MLAYVFSHRLVAGLDAATYEQTLRGFHAALAAAPPAGFVASTTYRIGDGYSDWYLVRDSAALDVLNEAAVSGARGPAHDAAARMATQGVGKLYSLASGDAPNGAGFEVRFSKPSGTSYANLYERLQAWKSGPGVSLWRRMMVLGPPPEFCLIAPSAVELPPEMHPEVLHREPI